MDTVLAIALLVLGIGLVVGGADAFVEGLLEVGGRLRISPFALMVLLSGFEAENLAAGIAANAKGLPGAAAGTVFGGVTFLALGVAGIGAMIAPIQARLPRRFLVWTALSPLPALALSLDGELSRADGAVLTAWFAVALWGVARSGGSQVYETPPTRQRHSALRLLGGLALLTGGGALLADGLRRAISHLGVSQTLLGNTAVAASVEAEELARVAVPTRRGRPDLALANIAGTIVHFIGLNAGVIALVKPLPLDSVTRAFYLPTAVVATAVLCGMVAARGGLSRAAGVVLASLYVVYVIAAIAIAAL
jgi:cation:H+ antiporter